MAEVSKEWTLGEGGRRGVVEECWRMVVGGVRVTRDFGMDEKRSECRG